MRPPAYHLAMPVHYGSGVVFASPHSGRDYSDSFLEQSVLDRNLIRSSEDAFVDQLFACAPDQKGADAYTTHRLREFIKVHARH